MVKKSQLFYTNAYKDIESKIVVTLNAHEDFLTVSTARSTRAAGDAIQDILGEEFENILGKWCAKYSVDFARRAMADLAFKDRDGLYYVVDVSTHRTDTYFNMPNLVSVERLARFYEDDNNYFVVLSIAYQVSGTKVIVSSAHFAPIEFYMWDCLTIGALGWGQIQIANSNYINVRKYSRKKWMLEFCDVMLGFYPKEVIKINERLERFRRIRKFWESKPNK
ncbi:MAG: hypothetical protein FJ006_09065 [Chloroflexi bacterium]|nr:hypothetical protein [Chloroflexota bacterium]